MRAVIHVGAHKTGTSLVQKYVRDNPELNGALRLAVIGRGDANRLVGWGGHLQERPELLRNRLEKEAARRPVAIFLSHENTLGRPFLPDRPGLYPDAPRSAEALAKICDGFDTQVVFYVRPVPDFLESYYLQTVHEGAWHSFPEWYGSLTGTHTWTPVVEALEAPFGPEQVILGDFAEISAGQNEFLRRFMTRAGLPQPPVIDYAPVRNASISARGLEIALDINRHLRSSKERQATRKFLQQYFSNRKDARARPMPDELRRSLTEQTTAEYQALAARAAEAVTSPPVSPGRPRSFGARLAARRLLATSPGGAAAKRFVQRVRGGARA
jgi:hypothetical protein